LWTTDSNTFASACFINREWYKQAQNVELYAHHLSRCPSYALSNQVITGPFRRNDLYRLKIKFAAEVRRNLFEGYMRPRKTLINLISINANSSAAFPGGEAFRFAFSPNGQTILALSSSRIYVLDATSDNIEVRREFKTLRRPISASITDDGSLLAVLSSKHQANIYGLTGAGTKHLQVLVLDNPPRTIALAHEGTVLAAAYEGGVEVFSLAANALSTDRRAVRSEAMDTLQFSGDGSMLVGSSQSLEEPNAVVITAPFYTENDPDLSSREIHSRMWTTQILFPQISSVCSHAELLQGHNEGDAAWLFAYDHSLMSFRAVRTDDTRTGVAYFLNPPARRFSIPPPTMAPSASACGTLVAAGFTVGGLWLYGVPERLDASPDMGAVVERHEQRWQGRAHLTSATGHIEPLMAYSPSVSGYSEDIEDDSIASKVDWRQSLFVKCRGLQSLEGITTAKWVERSEARNCDFPGKRLVVVAPGGLNSFSEELGDESMPVDGSRMCMLDFDYAPSAKEDREITIEVGDNEPELLKEHTGDIDVEVAMERRRTVRAVRGRGASSRSALSRSVTAASPPGGGYFEQGVRMTSVSQPSSPNDSVHTMTKTPAATIPANVSAAALHRSATIGGIRGARFPPRSPLPNLQSGAYAGRGNGRRDSAESWETPPPPYSSGGRPSPAASPQPMPAWINNQNPAGYGRGGHHPQMHMQNMHQPQQLQAQPNQYNTGAPVRYGNPGGLHLATVNEASVLHQGSRSVSLPFSAQPDLYSVPSRPSTHEGPVSAVDNEIPLRPTITHPISPPTPDRMVEPALPSPVMNARPVSASITLTGANLTNRLNHPVPPVPDQAQHRVSPPSSSGNPSIRPQQPPPQIPPDNYAFSQPTPDQMSNLHRRISQQRPEPLALVTNGAYPPGSTSRIAAPSPPRGAWGAAGVPGSPSFNKAQRSPHGQGLSRNNSRGSNRSIPQSHSTPNLHTPQRPPYGRLDTIDSIGSAPDTTFRARAGSVAHEIPTPIQEGFISNLPQNQVMGRRTQTDPMFEVKKRKKKGKKEEERSQVGGKERKGRCVVM
jgi:hypothetical protein